MLRNLEPVCSSSMALLMTLYYCLIYLIGDQKPMQMKRKKYWVICIMSGKELTPVVDKSSLAAVEVTWSHTQLARSSSIVVTHTTRILIFFLDACFKGKSNSNIVSPCKLLISTSSHCATMFKKTTNGFDSVDCITIEMIEMKALWHFSVFHVSIKRINLVEYALLLIIILLQIRVL